MTSDATHPATPATPRPASKAARAAFIAFVILAIMVWIGIAVGANVRAPGIIGLAAAVFGGMSAAVLTLAIGGWIALKLAEPYPATGVSDTPHADPAIAPALASLEAAQRPILRRMVERSAWRTPLFAAVAIAAWCVLVLVGASGGVFDFSVILLGGGLAGYGWSHREASKELTDLYLQRGAGTLAASHGDLAWRKPTRIDVARLRTEKVLPPASEAVSPGEIAGTHRGIAMRIAPIKTKPMPDKASATDGVFTGLLIELEAPHLSHASLEAAVAADPRLAVRIGQFGAITGLGVPASSASTGRISIAVPETSRPRVFDPPPSGDTKAAAKRLARVQQVLTTATGVADVLAAQPDGASQN